MLSILLKHKLSIALFFAVLGFFGWREIKLRSYINYQNRIIEQAKVNELRKAEEDSLAQIEYAEKNAELEGLYLIQKEETVKWRNQYFKILNAKQDTVKTGGIRVSFEKENPCMGVKGYTVTATEFEPEYAIVNIYNYPISIERKYMNVGGKIVEVIRPENDCVEFTRIAFDVPPSLYEKKQPRGSSFKTFLFGGVIGSAITFLLTR